MPNLLSTKDPWYEFTAMTKKTHLAIQEIYQYQDMTAVEISSVFFQLGVQKGAHLFYAMLQSFKIAARAANAGWSLVQLFQQFPSLIGSNELAKRLKDVENAFHDYSPDNFHPHLGDVEFAADCFEQFYNEAAGLNTKEEVEELLFQWTAKLRAEVEQRAAGLEKSTIKEVVSRAKARNPVT